MKHREGKDEIREQKTRGGHCCPRDMVGHLRNVQLTGFLRRQCNMNTLLEIDLQRMIVVIKTTHPNSMCLQDNIHRLLPAAPMDGLKYEDILLNKVTE